MEESISRMAGSYHGVKLEPTELVAAAHRAGRPAAERTTLYEIRRRYELESGRMTPRRPVVASLDGERTCG
jgi:FO synthase